MGALSRLMLAACCLSLAGCEDARTTYLDSAPERDLAFAALRRSIGDHARVLRIEIEPLSVAIEAQDPKNRQHVDRWRYVKHVAGKFAFSRPAGPEPVELQLINPNLEENLFDLDAVRLSAADGLAAEAVARARLQDPAHVVRMDIARQTYILPKPGSGDIRWTVRVDSGRERAEIAANAQGQIVRLDLAGTIRAKTLDILKEPGLVADAAADFRSTVGSGAVLTKVQIEPKAVAFSTNLRDKSFGAGASDMPALTPFTWDLSGLVRRIGTPDIQGAVNKDRPPPFSVDDVDWTLVGKLQTDALAAAGSPEGRIKDIAIAQDVESPGPPRLAWSVRVVGSDDEITTVLTDSHGALRRIDQPKNRRVAINWLESATLARALTRLPAELGSETKVAELHIDAGDARITIEDPSRDGRPAAFAFRGDGVARSAIVFGGRPGEARYLVKDLAFLTEARLNALEADASKRLGGRKALYLDSLTVGPHPFAPKLGARALEIRYRDTPDSSANSGWAWIVYDFNGRMQDFSAP